VCTQCGLNPKHKISPFGQLRVTMSSTTSGPLILGGIDILFGCHPRGPPISGASLMDVIHTEWASHFGGIPFGCHPHRVGLPLWGHPFWMSSTPSGHPILGASLLDVIHTEWASHFGGIPFGCHPHRVGIPFTGITGHGQVVITSTSGLCQEVHDQKYTETNKGYIYV
jgi:hypothetical protein